MLQKFYAFLDRPLFPSARIVLAILCIPLAYSIFQPLWRIAMEAPQYPDGLYMDIYANRIVGGNEGQHLQEINTLNHYIGMRPIEEEKFPDLGWMPFAIGVMVIVALRVAVIGNVRMLVDLLVMATYVFGFFGARFVYTMYVYGHDLDPRAPVTIEPFWPVILGTKEIANFTTHGTPLFGTYLVMAFVVGVLSITVWHLARGRREAIESSSAAKPAPAP